MNNDLIVTTLKQFDTSLNTESIAINAKNDIDAIKIWLNEYIQSPRTFISYKQCAERFVMWAIHNNLTLKQIKREEIAVFQEFLASPEPHDFWCGIAVARSHPRWKPFVKGLSNSSIRLNLQILSSLFEYLIHAGYLNVNPFKLIKLKSARLAPVNKSIDKFLTLNEWEILLEQIDKFPQTTKEEKQIYFRTRWIFNLLYYTGCRRSEIANAKMSDFIYKYEQWWLKVIGKGNKYGEIPIPPALLRELMNYRRFLGLSELPNSQKDINISLINRFKLGPNNTLIGITDSMLYKIIKERCHYISTMLLDYNPSASYVIDKVSTHWLRHTSATHQVDAGIDIRIVKENLRHSLIETTMKYQHTEQDKRYNETVKKFGK